MPKKRWRQQRETTRQPRETCTQLTGNRNHQQAQAEKLNRKDKMRGEIKTRQLVFSRGIKQGLGECQTTHQQCLLNEPEQPGWQ